MPKKFIVAAFTVLLVGLFWYLSQAQQQDGRLISPGVLGSKIATNLWLPSVEASDVSTGAPIITARAAYFVDADSGKVLYQNEPNLKLPIASLTKIMTVIVTLENKKWDDLITVSKRAAEMEPDHMELLAGEKLNVEELLDGVFLVSANDAAEALAESTFGDRDEFISQMNKKTLQLGMKDTKFINPTGLEEDDKTQYSTAYDVALMSRYAIKNFPHLVDISSEPHIVIPRTSDHQDYDLYSGINLLTTYPGVVGFKTGYTPQAGLTLVTLAEKDGHRVLGVLLNSEDRRSEAKELLDYSFSQINK